MSGILDLETLLASMQPILHDMEYVFISFPDRSYGDGKDLKPIASFSENEGLTLVIPRPQADAASFVYDGVFRMITLTVHSSLYAVGLTAAVAEVLSQHGISANIIAAYFHDHIFISLEHAQNAMSALDELSSRKPGAS